MREIKILAILVAIVGVIYWGVEPLAHSVFNPPKAPADYKFSDLKDLQVSLKGDAKRGETLARDNCIGCHTAFPENELKEINASAVMGPNLDTMGYLYSPEFLSALLKDPLKATMLSEKFKGDKEINYQMTTIAGTLEDQQIADIIAYLTSIAPKEMSNREVFIDACSRCHDVKYDGINGLKGIKVATPEAIVKEYLGAPAPDLSMMYRSKGEHYLSLFINDPQKMLSGASMPRVGLTQKAEKQVIEYMENIADPKKEERESLGLKLIAYAIIMAIIAYLWKRKIWKDLH